MCVKVQRYVLSELCWETCRQLVHNHVEGDIISTSLTNKDNVGSVKKIKNKKGSLLDKHSLENWTNIPDDPKPDISEGNE